MLKNIYFKATLLSIVLLLISCDKDDTPEAENEMEVLNKTVIVVTNLSDDSSETYNFEVEEHDHGQDHSVLPQTQDDDEHGDHTVIELKSGSEYKFEISFLNDTDPNNCLLYTSDAADE